MRALITAVSLLILAAPGFSAPRWGQSPLYVATGLPIVKDSERFSRAISDGDGGTFLAWVAADLIAPNGLKLQAQHVDKSGKRLWNQGNPLVIAGVPKVSYGNIGMAPDGNGGFVVSYQEVGSSGYNFGKLFLQRVNRDGRSLWSTEIPAGLGAQKYFLLGAGDGGVVALASKQSGTDGRERIFVFRADGRGRIAYSKDVYETIPATTLLFSPMGFAGAKPGEALFILSDKHETGSSQVYALRVRADGASSAVKLSADDWAGLNRELPCGRLLAAASDGKGGAFVSWVGEKDGRTALRLLRIDAEGRRLSPWPEGGAVVDDDAKTDKFGVTAAADGEGGVLLQYVARPRGPFETEPGAGVAKPRPNASCNESLRFVTSDTPAPYTADIWLARYSADNPAAPRFATRVGRQVAQEQHEVVRSGSSIFSSWVGEPSRDVIAQRTDLAGVPSFGAGAVVGSYKGTGSLGITVMPGADGSMVVAWKQSEHLYAQSFSAEAAKAAPEAERK
jgi:hypothetical protein